MPKRQISHGSRDVTPEEEKSYTYSSGHVQPVKGEMTYVKPKRGRLRGEPPHSLTAWGSSASAMKSGFNKAAMNTGPTSLTRNGEGRLEEMPLTKEVGSGEEFAVNDAGANTSVEENEGITSEANRCDLAVNISEPIKGRNKESSRGSGDIILLDGTATTTMTTTSSRNTTVRRVTTSSVRITADGVCSSNSAPGHGRILANTSVGAAINATSSTSATAMSINTTSTKTSGMGTTMSEASSNAVTRPLAKSKSSIPLLSNQHLSSAEGNSSRTVPTAHPSRAYSAHNSNLQAVEGGSYGHFSNSASHSFPNSPSSQNGENKNAGSRWSGDVSSLPSPFSAPFATIMNASAFPLGNDPMRMMGAHHGENSAGVDTSGMIIETTPVDTSSLSLFSNPHMPGTSNANNVLPLSHEDVETRRKHCGRGHTKEPSPRSVGGHSPLRSPPSCEHQRTVRSSRKRPSFSSSTSSQSRDDLKATYAPGVKKSRRSGSIPLCIPSIVENPLPSMFGNASISSCSTIARSGLVERRAKFDIGSLATLSMDNLQEEMHSPGLQMASPVPEFRGWFKIGSTSEGETPLKNLPAAGAALNAMQTAALGSTMIPLDAIEATSPCKSCSGRGVREGTTGGHGHGAADTCARSSKSRSGSSHRNENCSSAGIQSSESQASQRTLKMVSYNILAQRFVSTDEYPTCPPAALTEEHRLPLVMEELREAGADIVALSEISVQAFEGEPPLSIGYFLHHTLHYDGYHVANTHIDGREIHQAKPYCRNNSSENRAGNNSMQLAMVGGGQAFLSPSMSPAPLSEPSEKGNNPSSPSSHSPSRGEGDYASPSIDEIDGVALFFNNRRFNVLEVHPVYFNRIGAADSLLTPPERKVLLVKSHNVGLVLVLHDLWNPSWIFIVGTSHLIWRSEAQMWQLHHLIKVMEKVKIQYQQKPATPTTSGLPFGISTGSSTGSSFHATPTTTNTTSVTAASTPAAVEATRSAAGGSSFIVNDTVAPTPRSSPDIIENQQASSCSNTPREFQLPDGELAGEEEKQWRMSGGARLQEGDEGSTREGRSAASFWTTGAGEGAARTFHQSTVVPAAPTPPPHIEVFGGNAKHNATADGEKTPANKPTSIPRAEPVTQGMTGASGTDASGGGRGGESEGSSGLLTTSSPSLLTASSYHIACILAGDFNMEPNHPALDYARTGTIRSDAEVCKAWRELSSSPLLSNSRAPALSTNLSTPNFIPSITSVLPTASSLLPSHPSSSQLSQPVSTGLQGTSSGSGGLTSSSPSTLTNYSTFSTANSASTTASSAFHNTVPVTLSPRSVGAITDAAACLHPHGHSSFSGVDPVHGTPRSGASSNGSNSSGSKGPAALNSYPHAPHQALPPPLPMPSHGYRSLNVQRPALLTYRSALTGSTPRGTTLTPSSSVPVFHTSSIPNIAEGSCQNSHQSGSLGESGGSSGSNYILLSSTLSHIGTVSSTCTPGSLITSPPAVSATTPCPPSPSTVGRSFFGTGATITTSTPHNNNSSNNNTGVLTNSGKGFSLSSSSVAPRFYPSLPPAYISPTTGTISELPINADDSAGKNSTTMGEGIKGESTLRTPNSSASGVNSYELGSGTSGNSSGGRGGGCTSLTPLSPPIGSTHGGRGSLSSSLGVQTRTTSPRNGSLPLYSPISFIVPGCYSPSAANASPPTPTPPPYPHQDDYSGSRRPHHFHLCTPSKSEGEQPRSLQQLHPPYEYTRSSRCHPLRFDSDRSSGDRRKGSKKRGMMCNVSSTRTVELTGSLSERSLDAAEGRLAMTARNTSERPGRMEFSHPLQKWSSRPAFQRGEKSQRTLCLTPPATKRGPQPPDSPAELLPPPFSSTSFLPLDERPNKFATDSASNTDFERPGKNVKSSDNSSENNISSSDGLMRGIVMRINASENSLRGSDIPGERRHEVNASMMSCSIDGAGATRAGAEEFARLKGDENYMNNTMTVNNSGASSNRSSSVSHSSIRNLDGNMSSEELSGSKNEKGNPHTQSSGEVSSSSSSPFPPPPYHSLSLPTSSMVEVAPHLGESPSLSDLSDPLRSSDGVSREKKKNVFPPPIEEESSESALPSRGKEGRGEGGIEVEPIPPLLVLPPTGVALKEENDDINPSFPPLTSLGVGKKQRDEIPSVHTGELSLGVKIEGGKISGTTTITNATNHIYNSSSIPSIGIGPFPPSFSPSVGGRGGGGTNSSASGSGAGGAMDEKNNVLPDLARDDRSGHYYSAAGGGAGAAAALGRCGSEKMTLPLTSPVLPISPASLAPHGPSTSFPRILSPSASTCTPNSEPLGTASLLSRPSPSLLECWREGQKEDRKGKGNEDENEEEDHNKERKEEKPLEELSSAPAPLQQGMEGEMFMDCASPRPRKKAKRTIQEYATVSPKEEKRKEESRKDAYPVSSQLDDLCSESASIFQDCPSPQPRKRIMQPVPPSSLPVGGGRGAGGVNTPTSFHGADGSAAQPMTSGVRGTRGEGGGGSPALPCDTMLTNVSTPKIHSSGPSSSFTSELQSVRPCPPLPLVSSPALHGFSVFPPKSPSTSGSGQDAPSETSGSVFPSVSSGSYHLVPGRPILRLQSNRKSLNESIKQGRDGRSSATNSVSGSSTKSVAPLSGVSQGSTTSKAFIVSPYTDVGSPMTSVINPHPVAYHQLRFRNVYDTYIAKFPSRVTCSSGVNEGKVIDYILCDSTDILIPDSVLQLGDRTTTFPSWNCPSDHFMIGVIFTLQSPTARVSSASASSKASVSSSTG